MDCTYCCDFHAYLRVRIKDKLCSGELAVSGDQWPLFLYQGYDYNPEDPWNGLFKSTLLVYVCDSYLIHIQLY